MPIFKFPALLLAIFGGFILLLLTSCDFFSSENPKAPPGRIVFSHLDTVAWVSRVYSINTNGSELKVLHFPTDSTTLPDGKSTPRGSAYHPRWSSNGQMIVYEESQGPEESHLVFMNADGSNKRDLTPVGGYAVDPVISPDGSRILYFEGGWGLIFGTFTIDADGANRLCVFCIEEPPITIESDTMVFVSPAWGTTSDFLYLVGFPREERDGDEAHLYELQASTRQIVRRITAQPIPRGSTAQISPDGRRVLYWQGSGANRALYLLPSLDAAPEMLLRGSGLQYPPKDVRWANDSRHMVFRERESPSQSEIYIIDVDGDRTPMRVRTPFSQNENPDLYVSQ